MNDHNNSCYYTKIKGIPLSLLPIDCIGGLYCPNHNNASIPQICLPTEDCQLLRLQGKTCANVNGSYGAQGRYEPVLCPPGYYCGNPQSIQLCPNGHYCLTGSKFPKPCESLSFCPEGSIIQQSYVGILLALVLNLILLLIWVYYSSEAREIQNSEFRRDLTDVSTPLKMRWKSHQISFSYPSGKVVLDDLTFEIRPHRLTCIIGPSGAGKSTLLKILTGRTSAFTGTLEVCGKEVDPSIYKKFIAVVHQQDSLLEELTVFEMVMFNARMRSSRNINDEDISRAVQQVLFTLNLSEVSNILILYLSGGQRRRVSIAIELVSSPMSLFLDEPTSGLDATMALDVVKFLVSVARFGTTVVAVIHQPRMEIFSEFDDVIMLSSSGRIIFNGPTKDAHSYFEDLGFVFKAGVNDVDAIIDIINGNSNDLAMNISPAIDSTLSREDDFIFHSNSEKINNWRGASFATQFKLCHNLYCLQQLRKIKEFLLELVFSALVGLLTAVVMNKTLEPYVGAIKKPYTLLSPAPNFSNFMQIFFILGLTVAFCAVPSGVKVFSFEKDFYMKNNLSGHSALAYFLAKQAASFYRISMASLHYSAAYVIIARPLLQFSIFLPLIMLLYFGVYGVCSFVSIISSRENATLLAVILSFLSGSFSGYGPTLKQLGHFGIVLMLSFNFWGCEALFNETVLQYDHIYDTEIVVQIYGYTTGRTIFDLFMMLVVGIAWRILAYLCMVR